MRDQSRILAINTTDPTGDAHSTSPSLSAVNRSDAPLINQGYDCDASAWEFVEHLLAKPSRWSGSPGSDDESVTRENLYPVTLKPRSRSNRLPAFLVSMIVHTSLLIALCLFALPVSLESGDSLSMRLGRPTPSLPMEKIESEPQLDNRFDVSDAQPVIVKIETPLQSTMTVPTVATQPSDSMSSLDHATGMLASGGGSLGDGLLRLPTGGGLSGRLPDRRREIGRRNGATPQTEEAVELALDYLARHQRRDGSWSFDLSVKPCNGQCRHSRQRAKGGPFAATPPTAATGLALLAFLGQGYTHENDNPYRENIKRGIYFLRAISYKNDAGCDWQQGSMYAHAIALMALSEALTMTSSDVTTGELVNENAIDYQLDHQALDERMRHELYPLVDQGANFTCVAQHRNGSWGYVAGSPGDTTMTGWHVLSLIAAKRNGVQLHTNTLANAKRFVLSTQGKKRFRFGYQTPPARPTTTAIGLTLMLYLGERLGDTSMDNALTELVEAGPLPNNIYHNYYASLALHHAQHHRWAEWNVLLQKRLLSTQEKKGHEKGSWHFKDQYGDVGGRLYTTAMCALTLEVYHRYMPLYQTRDADFPL